MVVDRTKISGKYFYQFMEVLEAEGPWLNDVKEKLKSDLRLKCPRFRILIVGRSCSGKSTVVNSLLNREAADVSNDLNHATDKVMAYDGETENVPVRIYDTQACCGTSQMKIRLILPWSRRS